MHASPLTFPPTKINSYFTDVKIKVFFELYILFFSPMDMNVNYFRPTILNGRTRLFSSICSEEGGGGT